MNNFGKTKLFAFNFTPREWLPCEGQILPISQYVQLYQLLGTTFGGDGKTTFGLPDLKDKAPAKGLHYCICYQGQMPRRA